MKKLINIIYIKVRDKLIEFYLKNVSDKKKFEIIYKYSYWRANRNESKSGYGSSFEATKNILIELENFIKKENVKSIFDAPCGDFYWLQKLNFTDLKYIGADIVRDMVNKNNENYSNKNIKFVEFDILNQVPNKFDLIINRDCLVHFRDEDVIRSLKNFKRSESKYFASTTYPKVSKNIKSDLPDNWRPINLSEKPFNLPKPYILLNDNFDYKDRRSNPEEEKYIGVWKIEDLKNIKFE